MSKNEQTVDLEQPLLSNEEREQEPLTAVPVPLPAIPISVVQEAFESDLPPAMPSAPTAQVIHGDEEAAVTPLPPATNPDRNRNIDAHGNVGQWRGGLCGCCAHGCCHPSFLYPFFCPLIAIGQVMRRINLALTGHRGSNMQSKLTFFVLCTISVLFFFYGPEMIDSYASQWTQKNENAHPWIHYILPSSVLSVLIFYLIIITRSHIRRQYRIPERCCVGCEDCCVAIFFPWCSISQMMRQTADYRVYRAVWFSDTGLPSGVEDDGLVVTE